MPTQVKPNTAAPQRISRPSAEEIQAFIKAAEARGIQLDQDKFLEKANAPDFYWANPFMAWPALMYTAWMYSFFPWFAAGASNTPAETPAPTQPTNNTTTTTPTPGTWVGGGE